jgi:nucleoside phosphorylase
VEALSGFELAYCVVVLLLTFTLRGSLGFGGAIGLPLLALVLPVKTIAPAWSLIGILSSAATSTARASSPSFPAARPASPRACSSMAELPSLMRPEKRYLPAPNGRLGRTRVAVISVIDEEFEAAQKALRAHKHIPGSSYYAVAPSKTNVWDVVLSQLTDRSNIPAAIDISTLIDDLRPQILVLVGIAGGMCDGKKPRDGLRLGDVVIGNFVSYVEFAKIAKGRMSGRNLALDHPSIPLNKNVSLAIQKSSPKKLSIKNPNGSRAFNVKIGEIASGEKIMGDVAHPVQIKLLKPFEKAIAFDMESAGMARTVCSRRSSFWYHPRYVVVRGISDLVSPKDNSATREKWKRFSASAAAEIVREFIHSLPADQPE